VWPRAWLTWTDGRSGGRQERQAASADRLPTGIDGLGGDGQVTPGAWLMRTDEQTGGRVQAMPPQSGVTACLFKSTSVVSCSRV